MGPFANLAELLWEVKSKIICLLLVHLYTFFLPDSYFIWFLKLDTWIISDTNLLLWSLFVLSFEIPKTFKLEFHLVVFNKKMSTLFFSLFNILLCSFVNIILCFLKTSRWFLSVHLNDCFVVMSFSGVCEILLCWVQVLVYLNFLSFKYWDSRFWKQWFILMIHWSYL